MKGSPAALGRGSRRNYHGRMATDLPKEPSAIYGSAVGMIVLLDRPIARGVAMRFDGQLSTPLPPIVSVTQTAAYAPKRPSHGSDENLSGRVESCHFF
jgi:hypothetical protein